MVQPVRLVAEPSPPNLTLATLMLSPSLLPKHFSPIGSEVVGLLTPARRRLTDGKPYRVSGWGTAQPSVGKDGCGHQNSNAAGWAELCS
jgi:hypothetical protein